MTDEEKKAEPKAYVRDGYLKTYPYKQACQTLWDSLNKRQKQIVQQLPNFDAAVFFEITGIRIPVTITEEK